MIEGEKVLRLGEPKGPQACYTGCFLPRANLYIVTELLPPMFVRYGLSHLPIEPERSL